MAAGNEPFLMCVEDVFERNQGRMVMLTGRIERGRVREGDEVEIVGLDGGPILPVRGIETHRRRIGEAGADMNAGLLLPGGALGSVERGQVLATPGSVGAHACFTADITLLADEHGGADVRTGDRLQFHLRAAVVRGAVTLPHGMDALQPLHGGTVTVALERPVALTEGQSFAFRHHGRAAGTGTVTRLSN
ncbi:EF-Tu/IF-2/RF-3 family GTPase [Streptomyces sp. NPDC051133]|uniref:EF-Tu/IF-2/RF-3 family GTPase n=1 Tax=Streptomyces sp. NPDC051133 TaxID=3155521 RepID=UPI00341C1245